MRKIPGASCSGLLIAFALGFFACIPAWGGAFSVNPIKLDLGVAARSGVLVVKNEGLEKLTFQIEAKQWTQDADGKDQYTDSTDLIFFPKILSIDPGIEGVVRVGVKNPIVAAEKTYRVFIEELPGVAPPPSEPGTRGSAQISVLIRFGAPIFIAPAKSDDSADITSLFISNAVIALTVKNTGNRHQLIEGIELRGVDSSGKEIYALTLADRYLLNGASKGFKATVPADQCAKLVALSVELKTDKAGAKRKIDVNRSSCY